MSRRVAAALATALAGCPSPEPSCGWTTASGELDRVVLAAWGDGVGHDDVWFVGGGLGVAGTTALLLHARGDALDEVPLARSETLWWGWSEPAGGARWLVGEQGLVLRGDGESFAAVPSGTAATLYGVWGAGPDDVWIVGGLPGAAGDPDRGVVLHWDGASLSRDASAPSGRAFFKVWGASAEEVWVVGEGGALFRLRAGSWEDHSPAIATAASLLTVHGCAADEVYAVGGSHVWRWDGTAWTEEPVTAGAPLNGVSCGPAEVLAVGFAGGKLRRARETGRWTDEQLEEPWDTDFHGAFAAPDGALWAVGGNFLQPASAGPRRGVIGRYSCAP